jgi:hypothetical protein
MNNVNSFLPHNSQGDALRLRLYVLFDLAVVRMDDSALVAAGKSITTVTDHLLSKEVTDSSLLPGLSTIRQPIDRGMQHCCVFVCVLTTFLQSRHH